MKQMSLIEMDGFLKGKCIPSDLKVNETTAEYLVRKFGELESKLETALRECRSAGITIDNLEAKCDALAAENAALKEYLAPVGLAIEGTPATDAFLAEVQAQGVEMFGQYHNFSEKLFIQKEAQKFAAQLRKGGNQ
ncbi:hypothetical protein [Escherichia coli]|uniref:hypothetical protein n=1 Tax=Escherichia coli TaxID=562 RepID=UPI0022E573B4|nr:hypothetical protein [Escherichia coli]